VISAIDGMAGVGKTALAVHAAHQLADRYPDGQFFVDLYAYTDGHEPVEPLAALDNLLRALGVPSARIPEGLDERAEVWRAELAHRKVLIVLDNAISANQVRPLLPGTAGSLVRVTSRRHLPDLDATRLLSLDVLSPRTPPCCSLGSSARAGPRPSPKRSRRSSGCAAAFRSRSGSPPLGCARTAWPLGHPTVHCGTCSSSAARLAAQTSAASSSMSG
jgi:hypothetical protein